MGSTSGATLAAVAFGLSASGLSIARLADIKAQLEARFRAEFGNNVRLDPASVFAQLLGIFAERESLLWELDEKLYGAAYPATAEGVSLDRIMALVGVPRLPARASTVTATLAGTPATVVPAGSAATVTGTGKRFALDADATIGGGGTVSAEFAATETGPIVCLAGQLTTIATPVGGWTAITNPLDADLGRDIETDAQYRARQALLRRTVAGSSMPAILTALSRLADVEEVYGIENRTASTDVDGRPGHSIELVVRGGEDQDIADTIWATKPAGIETVGTTETTALDALGEAQPVAFSRPTEVELWIAVDYTPTGAFPANGLTEIRDTILAYGAELHVGQDVLPWEIEQRIETRGLRRLSVRVGRTDLAAIHDPYDVPRTAVALLDSTRITFHASTV